MSDGVDSSSLAPNELVAEKYRIKRTLGRGGMGAVYLARHEFLGTRVALKVLHKEALAGPDAAKRFMNEARVAASIQSEHVCRASDVGRMDDGGLFIVFEYLDGSNFEQVLAQGGPLRPELAAQYVMQALEALAHAHARGIVHRDLKPANIFLARQKDRPSIVKVLDFGMAKALRRSAAADISTDRGVLVGSPAYMAPEQLRGQAVDTRVDIWAMGAILYELVSGHHPFSPPGSSAGDLLGNVLEGRMVPLSRVAAANPAIEYVIRGCLAADPGHRFGTVLELAVALAPVAGTEALASIDRIASALDAPDSTTARRRVPSVVASVASPDSPVPETAPDPPAAFAPTVPPPNPDPAFYASPAAAGGASSAFASPPLPTGLGALLDPRRGGSYAPPGSPGSHAPRASSASQAADAPRFSPTLRLDTVPGRQDAVPSGPRDPAGAHAHTQRRADEIVAGPRLSLPAPTRNAPGRGQGALVAVISIVALLLVLAAIAAGVVLLRRR